MTRIQSTSSVIGVPLSAPKFVSTRKTSSGSSRSLAGVETSQSGSSAASAHSLA